MSPERRDMPPVFPWPHGPAAGPRVAGRLGAPARPPSGRPGRSRSRAARGGRAAARPGCDPGRADPVHRRERAGMGPRRGAYRSSRRALCGSSPAPSRRPDRRAVPTAGRHRPHRPRPDRPSGRGRVGDEVARPASVAVGSARTPSGARPHRPRRPLGSGRFRWPTVPRLRSPGRHRRSRVGRCLKFSGLRIGTVL